MGVLEKLMFWKKETVDLDHDLDYEVNGCFTLPTDGTVEAAVDGLTEATSSVAEDQAPEQC